jgi:DNA-binding response OmpR family regulator
MIGEKKILVVDDEKHMVRLMEYNLKKQGYSVDTAFNGMDAMHKVEEKKPDLILLDIKMPVMNGFEVCVKLKENPETRNIPIIIVSVIADKEEIASLEVASHIAKPFDPVELVNEVKLAFAQRNGGSSQ